MKTNKKTLYKMGIGVTSVLGIIIALYLFQHKKINAAAGQDVDMTQNTIVPDRQSKNPALVESLNKAFADEWLAYYQYWIGAKVAKGHIRPSVACELEEHAKEELSHANLLAERIIQLEGTPLLSPESWYKKTICGYSAPTDEFVKKILEQNLDGERCAIKAYKEIIEQVKDKDHVTYLLIVKILADEEKHEIDLLHLLEDINIMLKK